MDAYDRLAAINEALISIDEKTTVAGRIGRVAQTVGATIRKFTRRGAVFTPRGAQSRSATGKVRMPDDVIASNQPNKTLGFRGSVGKRLRGQMRSVKQAVKKAGGIVTRSSGAGSAGTLDTATGRDTPPRYGSAPLDVGSVSNIPMSGDQAGRFDASGLHLNPNSTKRLEKRATVVGTTDKMTPREKYKTLKQMRRNRDASNYTRGMGDSFKRDKKALDSSPFSSGMTRRGASQGADRIELTGRSR